MYNAKIITESGAIVGFGYEYGVLFDISPLSGIDVDVKTSQGFQQIGTTVESQGVSGLTRTIKGKFINPNANEAKYMIDNLPIFTKGKLYFNDEYYCNIYVKKTPVVAVKKRTLTFTMQVYCSEPFWYKIGGNNYSMGEWTKLFEFPVEYDSHIYARKNAAVFVNCYNSGSVKVAPTIKFTASSTVSDFGLVNAETLEVIRINTEINVGETVTIYRENGRLHVIREDGVSTDDIFEYLDEESNLYWIYSGDNILKMTAEENVEALQCTVSFESAYTGVIADVC